MAISFLRKEREQQMAGVVRSEEMCLYVLVTGEILACF